MELEIVRAHAAAAADATIGIAHQLATVPLDGTDVRPVINAIYNSADHLPIARRAIAAEGSGLTLPAVAIYIADAAMLENVHTVIRDGLFPVAISYLELENDSAKGNRDASYVMRAAFRFLTKFADPSNQAFRARNGIQLLWPSTDRGEHPIRLSPVWQKWDAAWVQSTAMVTWRVRETAA